VAAVQLQLRGACAAAGQLIVPGQRTCRLHFIAVTIGGLYDRCSNGESHHHRPSATRHPPRGPTGVHSQRRRTRSAMHTARYNTITAPRHPPPTEMPEPGHTEGAPSINQTFFFFNFPLPPFPPLRLKKKIYCEKKPKKSHISLVKIVLVQSIYCADITLLIYLA
jgi:hypothetical protein